MGHTHDEITQPLAERRCWEVARRDDDRVAGRLSRTPRVDGVSRRDEGALLDACVQFLQAIGVMGLLEEAHGTARPRAMGPFGPDVLRDGVQTRLGMERIQARRRVRCRDEARMPLVGCKAPPVRQGLGQRGAPTRQGERLPGPIGPATLAQQSTTWHRRELAAVCHGAMRALAQAGVCGQPVTGMADGSDLETTAR
jgi:hypothetical protein